MGQVNLLKLVIYPNKHALLLLGAGGRDTAQWFGRHASQAEDPSFQLCCLHLKKSGRQWERPLFVPDARELLPLRR